MLKYICFVGVLVNICKNAQICARQRAATQTRKYVIKRIYAQTFVNICKNARRMLQDTPIQVTPIKYSLIMEMVDHLQRVIT